MSTGTLGEFLLHDQSEHPARLYPFLDWIAERLKKLYGLREEVQAIERELAPFAFKMDYGRQDLAANQEADRRYLDALYRATKYGAELEDDKSLDDCVRCGGEATSMTGGIGPLCDQCSLPQ